MADTFNVHQAKTHLSELLERALAGEEIVIAKANKPIVKLVPVTPRPKKRIAGLGAAFGYWMSPDFDKPLPDEFWLGDASDPLYAKPKRRTASRTGRIRRARGARKVRR